MLTEQRVVRRLLTNPLDYTWHPRYGAGLGRFVGQVAPAARIKAITQRQLKRERGVGPSPVPTVDVQATNTGMVAATVRYADRNGGQAQVQVTP